MTTEELKNAYNNEYINLLTNLDVINDLLTNERLNRLLAKLDDVSTEKISWMVKAFFSGIRNIIAKLIKAIEHIVYYFKHILIIVLNKIQKYITHRSGKYEEMFRTEQKNIKAVYIDILMENFITKSRKDIIDLFNASSLQSLITIKNRIKLFSKRGDYDDNKNEQTRTNLGINGFRKCTDHDVKVYCDCFNHTIDYVYDSITKQSRELDKRKIELHHEYTRANTSRIEDRIPVLQQEIQLMKQKLLVSKQIAAYLGSCTKAIKIVKIDGSIIP